MTTIKFDLEEVEAQNLAFRLRVAVRLKELRKEYGLTLADLVSILSCAPTKESPGKTVTERQLEDVERAYHVVENPPYFYTMLFELFDQDPAFNPADIPPRIQKGRGDPTLKSRGWDDHLRMSWLNIYARELIEMRTLLDVAKSEAKTVDVGRPPQGLPAEQPKVDKPKVRDRVRKVRSPAAKHTKVAVSSGPSPADLTHEWAAQAAQDFRGWLKDHGLVRVRFAKEIGISTITIGQICVGNNIRTDIEPYVILHIRTGLPIFHPDRIPPRAIWSTNEWTVSERDWSHKEYWLKQLAAFALLEPGQPVPPELYAIPQDEAETSTVEAEVPVVTDEQHTIVKDDTPPELPAPMPEAVLEGAADIVLPERDVAEPAPPATVSQAALQFDALVLLLTQSLIGQMTAQIQQALPAAGQQLAVPELIESIKAAVTEVLGPLLTTLESAINVQEQLSQQLRALIDATQVQQDPGRDLSLAMRRFTRLLEDEMRKGPNERKAVAEQIGRTLAQRLWMIDIITSELEQIEERYKQHQIVGR